MFFKFTKMKMQHTAFLIDKVIQQILLGEFIQEEIQEGEWLLILTHVMKVLKYGHQVWDYIQMMERKSVMKLHYQLILAFGGIGIYSENYSIIIGIKRKVSVSGKLTSGIIKRKNWLTF